MCSKFFFACIFICVLLALFNITSSESRGQYDILMECKSNEHYTEMEQFTEYHIKITNNGDFEDTYMLTKDSPPEHWQTQLSIGIITIPSGESRYITLKVKPTCECESGVKVFINVTAKSQSNPNIFDFVHTITTYANVKVSLIKEIDYIQIDPGESCEYQFRVKNEGSENDSFGLIVSCPSELEAFLDNYEIFLINNSYKSIALSLSSSRATSMGYYEIFVDAISNHNSNKKDRIIFTSIVGKIDLKIQNITLSNKYINIGETIEISFEIINNGSVILKDSMISLYIITSENYTEEIYSMKISIDPNKSFKIHKDFTIESNFTGIYIAVNYEGNYLFWNETITKTDLGLVFKKSKSFPIFMFIPIILIIISVAIVFNKRLRK